MHHLSELKRKSIKELTELAGELHIDGTGSMRRQELVFAILKVHGEGRGDLMAEGVIEILPDGFGFLRAPDCNYLPGADDVYVSPSQIRRFNLRTGDTVSGQIRTPKESERYFALLKVEAVNGESPDAQRIKILFENLTPLHPDRRFQLEHSPASVSTRILDLLCPLGRGQRCLIVSPPRAGKTLLLQDIAHAIERNHPDTAVFVLLLDERPEEVTAMRRAVRGEVISSTFDEPPARHVQLAEIVLEKAKRMAENKRDVLILLDSITRMVRAYNHVAPSSGKLLPGGLDASALHKPKRFFSAARNLEEGGSLSIIATATIDTGSRLDDAIFEELQGTGNAEIHLDRALMEKRIFPCLDLARSGTRKEELLLPEQMLNPIRTLRSRLHPLGVEGSLELLRDKMIHTGTNADLVASLSTWAPASD
jgi:transcription termination factor Rho